MEKIVTNDTKLLKSSNGHQALGLKCPADELKFSISGVQHKKLVQFFSQRVSDRILPHNSVVVLILLFKQ
jgi:hypothetical protein